MIIIKIVLFIYYITFTYISMDENDYSILDYVIVLGIPMCTMLITIILSILIIYKIHKIKEYGNVNFHIKND